MAAAPVLPDVSLADKYTLPEGRVFLNGTQALVRLLLDQRREDAARGLTTGAYVSGYRGSPLGALDQELARNRRLLDPHRVRFQPAVNEDLAATAIWGSQQTGLFPGARVQGVVGLWYGKGPGVDRSGDALRHANMAGTAPLGGVLLLAGDDHGAKSSTVAHHSEPALMDARIPVLHPADLSEILSLGRIGWEMSRFSGCWVALKCAGELLDTTASLLLPTPRPLVRPEIALPPGGLHIRLSDTPLAQEERLIVHKVPAALAFARANRLDRVILGPDRARLGLVTSGKSTADVRQALADLGLGDDLLGTLGLAVYQVALPWPLEPDGLTAFAEGLSSLLVVEEKRPVMEPQIKELLYPRPDRPTIHGKTDPEGRPLLASHGVLGPLDVARAVVGWLEDALGADFPAADRLRQRLAELTARATPPAPPAERQRTPYFCAGCPHNTSTKVPEGSRALAGIGCHYLVQGMGRNTATFTHMGAEGASWLGQAPFTDTPHVFCNMGDGTYFHSGLMAIRAAVASGVNITYKLLFNDAVAMTGGQPMDGPLTPVSLARQLAAEGVAKVVVVSDDPGRYPAGLPWPKGTTIHHRRDLDTVQKTLRRHPGVSALIHDQTCAAEKRRRRKRGTMPEPDEAVVINPWVCEGCGDCGAVSNCVAIQPLPTPEGLKRRVDPSACNKDFLCLDGFCPAFVTVKGARPKRTAHPAPEAAGLPAPPPPPAGLAEPYGIIVTGIGGTGVVTVGALLGMAAHLDGRAVSILDQTGLAQKNGAVVSHIRLADTPEALAAARLGPGQADLVLGADLLTAGGADTLTRMAPGRTRAILNTDSPVTADFTRDPAATLPAEPVMAGMTDALGAQAVVRLAAGRLASGLMGDTLAVNPFLLGFAWQKGWIPLSEAALMRAIELNGVAVTANQAAFRWGRQGAVDEAALWHNLGLSETPAPEPDLDDDLAQRRESLRDSHGAAAAQRFDALIARVRAAESAATPGRDALTRAVARGWHKRLAFKDEYEVARLFSDGRFDAWLAERYQGITRRRHHMAPPLLARTDPATGRPAKLAFGPWMKPTLGLLARLRSLRDGPFDPFRFSSERKLHHRLIADYQRQIESLLPGLSAETHARAVETARRTLDIKGFGPVLNANAEASQGGAAPLEPPPGGPGGPPGPPP
ncbi:indolepyruvate ferredoxin oxidoreductase family protein [Roseospirillum parvum]|uniref:Indolepyruvate ferredoxin oxidoreductase n=1 Tax=Roseospirillum parvum TaxID=83401 RepID=A0A1G7VAT4_9PROT|nr:indolepyruvate ferredoxin oxidoreductase family protein [Roseospirillum parvum]SDG56863.1 indolepyruvate ferredoxin oxidoreductase [Roseospirillum parvum]